MTAEAKLVAALTDGAELSLERRLKKHGLEMDDYVAAVSDPVAVQRLLEHCRNVYLMAALPATMESLGSKAAAGDPKAQETVLSLFSEKSPLRDYMGLSPETMSDAGVDKALGSMIERLADLQGRMHDAKVDSGGGPGPGGDELRGD